MRPRLFTFDIFGTVLDWQTGLRESVTAAGFPFDPIRDMDRVIDLQGKEEHEGYKPYRMITKNSLVEAFGMPKDVADQIGQGVGTWPLFKDSRAALKELMRVAPCIAMTNSDSTHGEQVQSQLGFTLSEWVCAQDTHAYKPNPDFWKFVSEKINLPFGKHWWHVSAYADYDLETARKLGLTCVFVKRPHSRRGAADLEVQDLGELVKRAEEA